MQNVAWGFMTLRVARVTSNCSLRTLVADALEELLFLLHKYGGEM